jgi:hypothetical protein
VRKKNKIDITHRCDDEGKHLAEKDAITCSHHKKKVMQN